MRVKRCYPYFIQSVLSSSIMLLGIVLGCVMLYFNRNTRLGIIMSSIVIAIMVSGELLEIFVCNVFEYWGMDETAVYAKKLFRKKVTIFFDRIDSVEESTVDRLFLASPFTDEVYLICEGNRKIAITKGDILTRKKVALLEERLKPYMKKSVPQADAPQT